MKNKETKSKKVEELKVDDILGDETSLEPLDGSEEPIADDEETIDPAKELEEIKKIFLENHGRHRAPRLKR